MGDKQGIPWENKERLNHMTEYSADPERVFFCLDGRALLVQLGQRESASISLSESKFN